MSSAPVRSFRFDSPTDARLRNAANREGVSMTEVVRRALIVREEMLKLTTPPGRLFGTNRTELPTPDGFTQLVFLGGM